jgi:hypothetical protein
MRMPIDCADCNATFIPRRGFELRCLACYVKRQRANQEAGRLFFEQFRAEQRQRERKPRGFFAIGRERK